MKHGYLILLFIGLPFGVFGVVLLRLAASSLFDWQEMQSWEPAPAELLAAKLVHRRTSRKYGTSYDLTARYRYRYAGQVYEGDRVTILRSGNFPLGRQLEHTLAREEPVVTVYVNPRSPRESIIHRELKGEEIAAMGVVGLLFGGAGLGVMGLGWRARRVFAAAAPQRAGESDADFARRAWAEYKARKSSASTRIRSGGIGSIFPSWAFAAMFCGMSIGPVVLKWSEASGWETGLLLLWGLLFGAFGVLCAIDATAKTLKWLRFGALVLNPDPNPGSIGGDFGGIVNLPVRFAADRCASVTLDCTHTHIPLGARKQETSRWSDTRHFLCEPGTRGGSRLHFRIPVPAGLPASSDDDAHHNSHAWSLRLEYGSFKHTLPVTVTAGARSTRMAMKVRERPRPAGRT